VGDALKKALTGEADGMVRGQAARSMGESDDPSLVEPLVAAVEGDKEPTVRQAAAASLGARRETKAVPTLIREVQRDSSLDVRQEAAAALGRIGGPEAKEALTYFAQHSLFPQIRRVAVEVLEEDADRLNAAAPAAPKPR
jgi:HEAT repeat protein